MANGEAKGTEQLMPEVALILAILLPGTGQFYNGQFLKGLLFGIGSMLIIPWFWGMYDAYTVTKRINAGEIVPTRSGCLHAFVCFVALVAIEFGVIFAIVLGVMLAGVELPPELTGGMQPQ